MRADYLGQQLGNYLLIQLLGQGGFAQVYLGKHVRLGMKAAIKILHARLTGEELQAFQKEARLIAGLSHPQIIRVHDFDVQQSIPFLVLDYAPNGSLGQKHPKGTRLPLSLVCSYVTQLAAALQYAHEHQLIHRDIKPENMLVGEQGNILLSDFGIATLAHSTSSLSTQDVVGTPAYMAPEQILGKPHKKSDQYALAVTAYQWLTGILPFQGSSTEIIAQHLMTKPEPPGNIVPDIPREVEQVLLKALAKEPQQRFSTVEAFASALIQARRAADHQGDRALPSSPLPALLAPTIAATRPAPAARPDPHPTPLAPTIAATLLTSTPMLLPHPQTPAPEPVAKLPTLPHKPLPHSATPAARRLTRPSLSLGIIEAMIPLLAFLLRFAHAGFNALAFLKNYPSDPVLWQTALLFFPNASCGFSTGGLVSVYNFSGSGTQTIATNAGAFLCNLVPGQTNIGTTSLGKMVPLLFASYPVYFFFPPVCTLIASAIGLLHTTSTSKFWNPWIKFWPIAVCLLIMLLETWIETSPLKSAGIDPGGNFLLQGAMSYTILMIPLILLLDIFCTMIIACIIMISHKIQKLLRPLRGK